MTKLVYFNTVLGPFYIVRHRDGTYHPYIEDHDLGCYDSIVDAIEGIAYNTSLMWRHPEFGDYLDPTDLDIPDDISCWKPV